MTARTIHVSYLSRVEGEGSLTIQFQGNEAREARLDIFEPPRFIEGLVRGRSQLDAPDITARICGICPFAHQTAASLAIEEAVGIRVEGALRDLRRLIHCGSWIESHVLHAFMLHAPDFLGVPDLIEMSRRHGPQVKAALRMKKAGNALCARVGGREIHPVNPRVGGFWRAPRRDELAELLPELEWALGAAEESIPFLAGLPFPDFERDHELVSLCHPDEYPMFEGRLVSNRGLDVAPAEYEANVSEEHVQRSNALHARIKGRGAFLVGPLARFNLNHDKLTPRAQAAARAAGIAPGLSNPFKSLLVRAVETVHCFDEAIALIRRYREPERSHLEVPRRAGTGHALVEAPRGTLYHRFAVGEDGLVRSARIVVPTSHNLKTIEEDLLRIAPRLAVMPHDQATLLAEQAVRNYDPCISCSTHFLRLRMDRR